jgi:hypothetical protein
MAHRICFDLAQFSIDKLQKAIDLICFQSNPKNDSTLHKAASTVMKKIRHLDIGQFSKRLSNRTAEISKDIFCDSV